MYIISQYKDTIFNIDKANYIRLVENQIIVSFGDKISVLGEYLTDKRAKEVFEKIISEMPFTKMMEIPEE